MSPRRTRRLLWGGAVLIAGLAVLMLVLTRPWNASESSDTAASAPTASAGAVATMPEPTATDDQGRPVIPGDPFMPTAPPGGSLTPGATAMPTPLVPPSPPARPTPPQTIIPTPPPVPPSPPAVPEGDPVECRVWLRPGPAAQSVRLAVLAESDLQELWAVVRTPVGTQSGVVPLASGYGEQVIPGIPLVGTSVVIYASPGLTARSESCRFG